MIFRNLFAAAALLGGALLASLLALLAPAANAQTSPAAKIETKQQHDARMEWFRAAKFGMFIHWGVYSMPADVTVGADGLVCIKSTPFQRDLRREPVLWHNSNEVLGVPPCLNRI